LKSLHRRCASFDFAQDEVNRRWQTDSSLIILSEVEGRMTACPEIASRLSQGVEIEPIFGDA
jgi:hypothetical protein